MSAIFSNINEGADSEADAGASAPKIDAAKKDALTKTALSVTQAALRGMTPSAGGLPPLHPLRTLPLTLTSQPDPIHHANRRVFSLAPALVYPS